MDINLMETYCKNIVEKDDNLSNIGEVVQVAENSILLNYLANIQIIFMKNYYEKKANIILTKEEIAMMSSIMTPKTFDEILHYPTHNLAKADLEEIKKNLELIKQLAAKNVLRSWDYPFYKKKLNAIKNNNLHQLSTKSHCIRNISMREELNHFGLQEYLETKVKEILDLSKAQTIGYFLDNSIIYQKKLTRN